MSRGDWSPVVLMYSNRFPTTVSPVQCSIKSRQVTENRREIERRQKLSNVNLFKSSPLTETLVVRRVYIINMVFETENVEFL